MKNGSITSKQFSTNLSLFKREHRDRWCTQMNDIFRFQNVLEIMNNDLSELEIIVIEAQKVFHHELSKKDEKGLFLIHKCMNYNIFNKISEEEITKGV